MVLRRKGKERERWFGVVRYVQDVTWLVALVVRIPGGQRRPFPFSLYGHCFILLRADGGSESTQG